MRVFSALLVAASLSAPCMALAQTATVPPTPSAPAADSASQDTAAMNQIMALRDKLRTAIAKKDRAALDAIYADRFNHIRENGRVDMKRERIDLLLAGEPGIETAADDQMLIQAFGPDTVVLSGVSPIKGPGMKQPQEFQWLTVYVRMDGVWKVAVSQANRIPKTR